MLEALETWRRYPTEIESGLALYTHRDIGEWHRGTMSSRELLCIIEEFPETSRFKTARDLAYRLVRHDGKLKTFSTTGRLPEGAVVLATGVDWPHERKVAARMVRELALVRADGKGYTPDLSGLMPPLEADVARVEQQGLDQPEQRPVAVDHDQAHSVIMSQLYG